MPANRTRRHSGDNVDDENKSKAETIDSNAMDTEQNTNDKNSSKRTISSVHDLKGDKTMKYTHGQVVWAKFADFPWWPGTVALERKDKGGQQKVTVQWFGDYGEQSNECVRGKTLPFDPQLKDIIFKEVKKADHSSFESSVAEATRVWRELKEETGSTADSNQNVIMKTNEPPSITTSEEEGTSASNRPSRKRKLSGRGITTSSTARRAITISSANGKNGNNDAENSTEETATEPVRSRRTSQRLAGQTATDSPSEKDKEKKDNKTEDEPSSPRRSGRLQGRDIRAEATASRVRCLELTLKTHEPNDLSVFIAHQYYSYLEDGKNSDDALALVADKWNLDGDAVLEHIDEHEFEANKTLQKRRRRGA